jgi:hypothetical protein
MCSGLVRTFRKSAAPERKPLRRNPRARDIVEDSKIYAEDFRAYETSFARNAGQQQTERVVGTSRKYVMGEETYLGVITDLTSSVAG